MIPLWSVEWPAALERLVGGNSLLVFDFDGTLAPIVDDRESARMAARTARALRDVAALYPCAVVTGRAVDDVSRRLDEASLRYLIGNHGLEGGSLDPRSLAKLASEVEVVRGALAPELASLEGVEIEDKGHSLSVHYRAAKDSVHARATIQRVVSARFPTMRIVGGKFVVNLIPKGAPHKGDAVLHLKAVCAAENVLFVGDDTTDEDVFALDAPWLVSVRVGFERGSQAGFFVEDQSEVVVLLEQLAERRSGRVRP